MASYHAPAAATAIPPRKATIAGHPLAIPSGPAGTFASGTKVQVGSHRVVIVKYLSEGGFAHVYVVQLPQPVDGTSQAVLKRVAVPDKENLANMRTEVETMKKLKGHKKIVRYIDSHASQLKGGGYEVFLLMEYCAGGGLIDFMNTRLQNRLTEPEILKIFSDVAEGVACMHYLRPPLLHRDLKVENVLISKDGTSSMYKLCDFGSAARPRPAATTAAEGMLIEDDVQRHTTLQYRSPEMIDVYRKQPIDEKSDIWALGVLLYKLCYYTTPFEEVGQMAILNASFKYPAYPVFSDRLKMLIAGMLRENPQKRPNIYQVVRDVCLMRGTEVPIRDIYAERTHSEVRRNQQLPQPTGDIPEPKIGAYHSPPVQEKQLVPEITPMRRGRPTKVSDNHGSAKPSPSPLRFISSDPFAALDAPKGGSGDELSNRFPTLDQFSILHEKGSKFEFEQTSTESKAKPAASGLSQRVTNALADEAFARPAVPTKPYLASIPSDTRGEAVALEKKRTLESRSEPPRTQAPIAQPVPRKAAMISTGTMTSPSPPPSFSNRTIHRFPPQDPNKRPSSQPKALDSIPRRLDSLPSKRTSLLNRSQLDNLPTSPASSRPSLEGQRPSAMELGMANLTRSKSANAKTRPTSAYASFPDLPDRPPPHHHPHIPHHPHAHHHHHDLVRSAPDDEMAIEPSPLASDMDFLRAKEDESAGKKRDKRLSSGSRHAKRSSMPSVLSGTKNLLAGKFGEAFRRFETNAGSPDERVRSPSPDRNHLTGERNLTPITGSEATERSDDGHFALDDQEEFSPEARRELERRRLSQEEKRVAEAGAEYRRRLADKNETGGRGGGGNKPEGNTKAMAIQNKVQSLLNQENEKPAPKKTAEGYGRFTDVETRDPQMRNFEPPSHPPSKQSTPGTLPIERLNTVSGLRKVVSEGQRATTTRPADFTASAPPPASLPSRDSQPLTATNTALPRRPLAPPKPQSLRPSGTGPGTTPTSFTHPAHASTEPMSVPVPPGQAGLESPTAGDDWETNFSKRYPSLSGFELVETEIGGPRQGSSGSLGKDGERTKIREV